MGLCAVDDDGNRTDESFDQHNAFVSLHLETYGTLLASFIEL